EILGQRTHRRVVRLVAMFEIQFDIAPSGPEIQHLNLNRSQMRQQIGPDVLDPLLNVALSYADLIILAAVDFQEIQRTGQDAPPLRSVDAQVRKRRVEVERG